MAVSDEINRASGRGTPFALYYHALRALLEGVSQPDSLELVPLALALAAQVTDSPYSLLLVPAREPAVLRVEGARGIEPFPGNLTLPMDSAFGQALSGGQPVIIDSEALPGYPHIRHLLAVPLIFRSRCVGLVLVGRDDASPFSTLEQEVLRTMGVLLAMALDMHRLEDDARLAAIDGLTGLANYRTAQDHLAREIEWAARHKGEVSVVMLEIDDFAHVNNTYGHPEGNQTIQELAAIMREAVRGGDFISRYGGDEFLLVLPRTGKRGALELADRLRASVAQRNLPVGRTQPLGQLTVSLGIATYPEDGTTVSDLVQAADRAMYEAKAHGKNRSVAFQEVMRNRPHQYVAPKTASRPDSLTGLPDRSSIRDQLAQMIAGAGGFGTIYLVLLDVDNFAPLNRQLGKVRADGVLRAVADRLRRTVPPGAVAGRYSGDEFAVLLPARDRASALAFASEFCSLSRSAPLEVEGLVAPIPLTVTAGVAGYPDHGTSPEELFMRAELALIEAKQHHADVRVADEARR